MPMSRARDLLELLGKRCCVPAGTAERVACEPGGSPYGWRKRAESEANGWQGWLEAQGRCDCCLKKVWKALTIQELVCLARVRIVPLRKRPEVPAISTKQILVANGCFLMPTSQFSIFALTITSVFKCSFKSVKFLLKFHLLGPGQCG